jgi:hypothetical protein
VKVQVEFVEVEFMEVQVHVKVQVGEPRRHSCFVTVL